MKILPDYFSKATRIQKQINKRAARRIELFINCSDKLNSEQLNRNIDSISRYAAKHDCRLAFSPVKDSANNKVKMDVYKKELKLLEGSDGLPILATNNETLSGGEVLPQCKSDKSFMKAIRHIARKIMNNDPNWEQKLS